MSRPEALSAAEYHIVSRPANAPGVSSFCMCPGGRVVNATAWENASITNGVSDFARDGKFANSCLISTVTLPESFRLDDVYAMMEQVEREQFIRGGSDYAFPCQSAEDFLRRRATVKCRSYLICILNKSADNYRHIKLDFESFYNLGYNSGHNFYHIRL